MTPDLDVIVIGGGPAGVAAAVELRRQGVARVAILERDDALGGATRHCSHSPFGMRAFGRPYFGPAFGRRLAAEAQAAGVDIRLGHSVVEIGETLLVTSHRGVERLAAKRILVATGAREASRAARLLPGDRPVGVLTTGTLQASLAFHGLLPFRRPVILGSELVSLSAALTCLTHGARPAAMIEPMSHAAARAPLSWFPTLAAIPFFKGAHILDIRGAGRVEEVCIATADGTTRRIACDGLLLTGAFVPEAALLRTSGLPVDAASGGPAVDQEGRTTDAAIFATGNVLRAIETGGRAFEEGRAVGRAIATDLRRARTPADPLPVAFDAPVKLVMPSLLRPDIAEPAFRHFQIRFARRAKGRLSLLLDGRVVWSAQRLWGPERRVLVPIPEATARAGAVHFAFDEAP